MIKKLKKVVCFGGGNVVPNLVMAPLKKSGKFSITGVTSMVDDGGSTGQLREDFGVLPPGDIRRHILALSDAPTWKKDLWKFRFGREMFAGGHSGHSFANAFIAGVEKSVKDYGKVLDIVHNFMEIAGHRALPATTDQTYLAALLEDGGQILGENEIDVPLKHNTTLKIEKVYLYPAVNAYPETKTAIEDADALIFGPGDIYTSIIACFLPNGMKESIRKSKAKKILICSSMQKLGETSDFSVLDFANEIERYIGCDLNFVIYNTGTIPHEKLTAYKNENLYLKDMLTVNKNLPSQKFVGSNLLESDSVMEYSSEKVFNVLSKLIGK